MWRLTCLLLGLENRLRFVGLTRLIQKLFQDYYGASCNIGIFFLLFLSLSFFPYSWYSSDIFFPETFFIHTNSTPHNFFSFSFILISDKFQTLLYELSAKFSATCIRERHSGVISSHFYSTKNSLVRDPNTSIWMWTVELLNEDWLSENVFTLDGERSKRLECGRGSCSGGSCSAAETVQWKWSLVNLNFKACSEIRLF